MAAGDFGVHLDETPVALRPERVEPGAGRRLLEAGVDHAQMLLLGREIQLGEQFASCMIARRSLMKADARVPTTSLDDRVLAGGNEVRPQIAAERLATETQPALFDSTAPASPGIRQLSAGSPPGTRGSPLLRGARSLH